jgi:hypothetical protein
VASAERLVLSVDDRQDTKDRGLHGSFEVLQAQDSATDHLGDEGGTKPEAQPQDDSAHDE